MTIYIVLSDNFAGGSQGATLTEDQLSNCNIPALVQAGHLAAQTQPTGADKAESSKEK